MLMKKTFWVYFAILIIGLVVLAWPEQDNVMLIQLSKTHGPSKLDFAGILIIIVAYGAMVKMVWQSWNRLNQKLGRSRCYFLLASSFISMLFIVAGLWLENDVVLWIAVVFSTLLQGVLIFNAFTYR